MAGPCPQCGYENPTAEPVCGLCGALFTQSSDPAEGPPQPLRRPSPTAAIQPPPTAAPPPPPAQVRETVPLPLPVPMRRRGLYLPVGWKYLTIGLVLALAFTLTPTLRFMGWFLGSLFHETGHVLFAWYAGCPAFPAISLGGHAVAVHKPQNGAILLLVGLSLVAGALLAWRTRRFRGLALALLAAWPIFAFLKGPRELAFLLSGHLGELVFAGIFLWRARTGLAVEREAERPLYACLGWFLVARNVVLTFGLTFTQSARAWYATSGSFGLKNDYELLAQDVLHIPLEAVTGFMLIVSLSVFPIVLAATWMPPAPPVRQPPGVLTYSPSASRPPKRVIKPSRVETRQP